MLVVRSTMPVLLNASTTVYALLMYNPSEIVGNGGTTLTITGGFGW